MTPTISLPCPACRARLNAPVKFLGAWRTCPGCNVRFFVRVRAPQDAAPILITDVEPAAPAMAVLAAS